MLMLLPDRGPPGRPTPDPPANLRATLRRAGKGNDPGFRVEAEGLGSRCLEFMKSGVTLQGSV